MFPNLYAAKAIEVVLVMGEVLYLPGGRCLLQLSATSPTALLFYRSLYVYDRSIISYMQ